MSWVERRTKNIRAEICCKNEGELLTSDQLPAAVEYRGGRRIRARVRTCHCTFHLCRGAVVSSIEILFKLTAPFATSAFKFKLQSNIQHYVRTENIPMSTLDKLTQLFLAKFGNLHILILRRVEYELFEKKLEGRNSFFF